MELYVLDSSFRRSNLVEDFASLVWTERFTTNGDFQLVSNDISNILKLMPLPGPFDPPCLVSIRDSVVPMIVESHLIEKPKNAPPKITTTGRSFETFLDERETIRTIDSTAPRDPWNVAANKPADAVLSVIDTIIGPAAVIVEDRIPEISYTSTVAEAVPVPATQPQYPVEVKGLWTWAMETLKLGTPDTGVPLSGNRGPAGLKSILPALGGSQIAIVIYEGTDRRKTVVFNAIEERFDDTKHLLSTLGYKNVMVTAAATGLKPSTTKSDGIAPSGLRRRVGFQDLSSEITVPSTDPGFAQLLINKGLVELAANTQTVLFSGEIAEQQAARYGVDYFLGDMVTLAGEYNLTQDVRIAEFVRSQDTSGTKSYPTFEAISPGMTS